MKFKRIEIQGFKSFADPVTIELNEGITCIIGPNGSGKSNISDALRWVIGEQSSKMLRGNKMQDVIFAGTSTRKPKGMAEVTLVIDNSEGVLPLEYNEVAVTRRLYRSGEGEYLINGHQTRLKDVKELFMDTGIGVDGYSIIGQGKIADIVSSKADSRRQIFEEAAGIVLYKTRKAEAEQKLKAAVDNIERVRDIISEIEGRIDTLKEDSEKATEFISLRDKYKELGINIILHNIDGFEKSISAGKSDLEELSQRIQENSQKLEDFDSKIDNLMQRNDDLSDELSSANAEFIEIINSLNTINSSGQLNSERLSNIEKDLARLEEEISEIEGKLEVQRSHYDELLEKDKELLEQKKEAEAAYKSAVSQVEERKASYNDICQQIENSKNDIILLKNKEFSGNKDIETLEDYINTLKARREELSKEHLGKDDKQSKNMAVLDEIASKLSDKENEIKELQRTLYNVDNKIISEDNNIADLSKRINEINDQIGRISSRKNTIEEMESNYEGYNNAVRALMRKNFSGIIGTVSDLIEVDSKYSLAIETSLGAALQNIVCENDASAKSAVNWLKSSKAGRATFLPLSSIKGERKRMEASVVSMQGYIGVAADLVSFSDKYTNIINHLLGRVIVVDDMDAAIMISKKAFGNRIVTLDGEIISTSGSITGGRYQNKTANLLDRKKEISDLENKLRELHASSEKLKDERHNALESIQLCKKEKSSNAEKLQSLAIEFNVLKADKEHAEHLAKEASMQADKFANELSSIEEDIKNTEEMIEESKNNLKASADRIIETQNNLDNLITKEEELKQKLDSDNASIMDLKLKLTEHETRIYSQNELVERVKDQIMELEDKLNDHLENTKELKESRELLSSTGKESTQKREKLNKDKEELDQRIKDLNSELESNKEAHAAYQKERKESASQIENLRDQKYKLDLKVTRNETLLDAQKDKLWEEFEVSYLEALDMRVEDFAITSGNRQAKEIKLRMAELGDVNISSIEEYKQVKKRYDFLTAQEKDTADAMKELEDIISNMDKTIKSKFKETFDEVVINFEESFKELFGGGYAELTLEDESNPLESAIEITAQPPGKKLKNINLLSGGEKTLTAIALMCAVLKAKPTPFVILDEVEAALDEVNIERFSEYLRKFDDIQFTLITHQKATMEHADVLYGVTMPEQGISKMLSLKMV